jgi:DNA-binding response OmpR family regulator
MIYHDAQLARQLTPHLQRVLVLDAAPMSGRLLRDMLSDIGAIHIEIQTSNALAEEALERLDPQVVFTELNGPDLDGLAFTKALRRGDWPCRKAPVIMVSAEATGAAILAARHAGVHEFLRKPYTIKDVARRLDAALLRQRDWIEAVSYVGPDRRRFNSGDYVGPRKRLSDTPPTPDSERVTQALKILRAVIPAIESEPAQALRAMRVQADELNRAATASGDIKLLTAAGQLKRCLASATSSGRLWRPDVEASAAALWSYLPAEADKKPNLQIV